VWIWNLADELLPAATQIVDLYHAREHVHDLATHVVEAGCKAVIGQRLKLSGMRWNIPGAAAIATLRCQQASNRWDEIWQRPHSQTPPAGPTTQAS
jgi:hypothetical protein